MELGDLRSVEDPFLKSLLAHICFVVGMMIETRAATDTISEERYASGVACKPSHYDGR